MQTPGGWRLERGVHVRRRRVGEHERGERAATNGVCSSPSTPVIVRARTRVDRCAGAASWPCSRAQNGSTAGRNRARLPTGLLELPKSGCAGSNFHQSPSTSASSYPKRRDLTETYLPRPESLPVRNSVFRRAGPEPQISSRVAFMRSRRFIETRGSQRRRSRSAPPSSETERTRRN